LVKLEFVKKNSFFELEFSTNGTVQVLCDITNESYDQPIDAY